MVKRTLSEKQIQALAKGRYIRAQNIYNQRWEESQAFRAALENSYGSDLIFEIGKRTVSDILEKGIRRQVGDKMTRIKGTQALAIQTKSMLNAVNQKRQKDKYIANYLKAMRNSTVYDFTAEQIYYVQGLLEKLSIDHFRAIVIRGYLPDFVDIYADTSLYDTPEEFIEAIEYAVSFAPNEMPFEEIKGRFSKAQLKQYKELAKVLRADIKHAKQAIEKYGKAKVVYQENELKPLIREQEKKLKAELRAQRKSPSKDNLLK